MKLTPMEQPWVYIKKLQASFDYSKIKYTEDYYDAVSYTHLDVYKRQMFSTSKTVIRPHFLHLDST